MLASTGTAPIRYLSRMGKTNRKDTLESKIALLLGEHEIKTEEIAKAEKLIEELPAMRERLWEIETLVSACETIIKSDHPAWTRDHLKALRPFVHKIPVKLGSASKLALDVLRLADRPLTVKEIAIEVLRREDHPNPDTATITKVANTIGNTLRSKPRGAFIDHDGGWPARWWAVNNAPAKESE
jgi:hypothetical protein